MNFFLVVVHLFVSKKKKFCFFIQFCWFFFPLSTITMNKSLEKINQMGKKKIQSYFYWTILYSLFEFLFIFFAMTNADKEMEKKCIRNIRILMLMIMMKTRIKKCLEAIWFWNVKNTDKKVITIKFKKSIYIDEMRNASHQEF